MLARAGGALGRPPPLLLLLLLVALARAQLEQMPAPMAGARRSDCPIFCVCSTWLRLPKASCTGKSLFSIHTGVSNVVQALDLSNNSISELEDRGLSRAGLTRLKYLNLSMNSISEIGLNAFDDLRNLNVLDLSMNHIDFIAPDIFYYNKNLQILNLAGNKFNLHVPKIRSLSITELNLSGCRISYLPADTFAELKQLHKLNLSNNLLTELDRDVLLARPTLKHLLLGRNPWTCNMAFFSLKMYVRKANIRMDQVCEKPTLEAKFEKIIEKTLESSAGNELARTTRKPEPRAELTEPWDVESWREFEETIREGGEQPAESTASSVFAAALDNVSPFWLLLTGFFLGSGATILVTYLWLSTTISCLIPRIRRAERVDSPEANSQRVSLLRHLWQQENLPASEESSRANEAGPTIFLPGVGTAPSCPGTPPPPYREVMLHRNLYPRAAMVAAAQQASARAVSANE